MIHFLKNATTRLAREQEGAIVSAELMLIATILVIGVIVGLKSVRDSVVSELADVAQGFANIDQSFSFSGVCGHASHTAGSQFQDQVDFCDTSTMNSNNFQSSKCVNVAAWASSESGMSGWNNGY
ncbi:MAG: hypothetical protein JSS27_08630 [Planctomycetes bacterium]|nr:hypothetical protein [Planctomycetota bacterium]